MALSETDESIWLLDPSRWCDRDSAIRKFLDLIPGPGMAEGSYPEGYGPVLRDQTDQLNFVRQDWEVDIALDSLLDPRLQRDNADNETDK